MKIGENHFFSWKESLLFYRWTSFSLRITDGATSFPGHAWIVANFSVDEPEVPLCSRTRARVHVSLLCQTELIKPLKPGAWDFGIFVEKVQLVLFTYALPHSWFYLFNWMINRGIDFAGQFEVQNRLSVIREPRRLGAGICAEVRFQYRFDVWKKPVSGAVLQSKLRGCLPLLSRAVYKREYPRFVKRFSQYVIDQSKDKPILY